MTESNVLIFIAEDDQDDQELLMEAFITIAPHVQVVFFGDGEDLLAAPELNEPDLYPDLIVLDLNMPRKGGLETLAELKENKALAKIPVIIFTTSKNEDDKTKSFSLGASDFVEKPASYAGLLGSIKKIASTWLKVSH